MKARFGPRLFLLALLLLLLACQQTSDAPTPAAPAPPSPPAPQTARPLTADEREAIAEFAERRRSISQERDMLYQEFDDWRSGLTACHPSAAQEALRDFAADSNAITAQAQNLPRASSTRELADLLIQAAEAEEAAYRQLRDYWQPNNVSLFETVERLRSDAARAQKNAQDRTLELKEELADSPTAAEVAEMKAFSPTFDSIKESWSNFHDAYATLRSQEDGLEIPDLIARYNSLIRQLRDLADTLAGLQPTDTTASVIEPLRQAADAQLAALSNLSEFLAATAAAPAPEPEPEPGEPPLSPDEAPESPEPPPNAEPPPAQQRGGPLWDAADAAATESQAALEKARHSIETVTEDKSEQNLADVKDFEAQYNRLITEWDAFHQRYNDWRRTDGGCDRVETIQSLNQFSQRANNLSRQVRNLPQSGFLLPIQTLLTEAAAREAAAIRALYNTWRPFTTAPFIAADQERANANTQRRQANTAQQQLQSRP